MPLWLPKRRTISATLCKIEAFIATIDDLGVTKGAIVSAHGFSEGAIQRGKDAGIETYELIATGDHPWAKLLSISFAALLRPIVETVDQFGLKARHLHRHGKSVVRFYDALSQRNYQTELAAAYRRRFEKYRGRLFTFLDYDGIPWNNNNAEHAIKAFARLRNVIGTNSTAKSMRDYLVLLSVAETCKCKGLNFLSFLRSGATDINGFDGNL